MPAPGQHRPKSRRCDAQRTGNAHEARFRPDGEEMTNKKQKQHRPFLVDGRTFVRPSMRTLRNLPNKRLATPRGAAANKLIETFLFTGIYASWTGGQFWVIVEYCLANDVEFKLYRNAEDRASWLIEAKTSQLKLSNPEDWMEVTWSS